MTDPTMWWERPGLDVRDGRLAIAGRDAESLAREHGTPLYVFDLPRVGEQLRGLQDAFAKIDQPFRLRYALKSNREPEVLSYLRSLGLPGDERSVGMDVCSPGEVLYALSHGWAPDEISYTGTNVSDHDLDVILEHGVHINLDLVTQIRRYGRRAPGSTIGIRVNPKTGVMTGDDDGKILYASATKPTKFGIYPEQLHEAIAAAREFDLTIDTVHFHVGNGFLTEDLAGLEVATARVAEMVATLQAEDFPITEVNAGGGLGVPEAPGHAPLDPNAYAAMLTKHLGPLGVTIACEPGDYSTKESAILLLEVVSVEDRLGVTFAGTDAGFNVAPDHFIYAAPVPLVLTRAADAPSTHPYTVSGNINEGPDLWGEHVEMPEVREGDILAALLVGTYNQSMQMLHCLRPPADAVYFSDRR